MVAVQVGSPEGVLLPSGVIVVAPPPPPMALRHSASTWNASIKTHLTTSSVAVKQGKMHS